jgi:hypothetical protein
MFYNLHNEDFEMARILSWGARTRRGIYFDLDSPEGLGRLKLRRRGTRGRCRQRRWSARVPGGRRCRGHGLEAAR